VAPVPIAGLTRMWGDPAGKRGFAGYREVQRSNWLLAGLLTCIVLIAMWPPVRRPQQTALAEFVAPHLRQRLTGSVSKVGRSVQRGLLSASVLCLFAALAGPELGYHWKESAAAATRSSSRRHVRAVC